MKKLLTTSCIALSLMSGQSYSLDNPIENIIKKSPTLQSIRRLYQPQINTDCIITEDYSNSLLREISTKKITKDESSRALNAMKKEIADARSSFKEALMNGKVIHGTALLGVLSVALLSYAGLYQKHLMLTLPLGILTTLVGTSNGYVIYKLYRTIHYLNTIENMVETCNNAVIPHKKS